MAETIGTIILAAAGALDVAGATAFTIAGTAVTVSTVVGTAAIIGTSIGLQYALAARPSLPKPEDGSQPIKQAIPPRIMGYGTNRLAGYYMLFEAGMASVPGSFDAIAFHSGRVETVRQVYLTDDLVGFDADITHGGVGNVLPMDGDGKYAGITFEIKLGTVPQAASGVLIANPQISPIWTPAHQGNGIAYAVMTCAGFGDPEAFTKHYPRNLPVPSVVADCTAIWDPRSPMQSRTNPSTWQVSKNPVLQLIDYLTRADGGMGLDFDQVIAPNLDAWLTEANLCDEQVATAEGTQEARYQSNGWFQFDNNPSDVIGGILSTCDGWLGETGDGALTIVVGVYRPPADPPLTEKHVLGFAVNYGQADEQIVNQLEISFTDPVQKYVTVQAAPWRDEQAISLSGAVRSQPLELKWVQSYSQARRLADRAMQRLNPSMSGSFTTTLYGLRYLGRRWVPLQYPFVSGLQDCVVEIQSAEVDLMKGRIVWQFNRIGDDIDAYDPATDEGAPPVTPPSLSNTRLDFSFAPDSQYLAIFEDI